LNLIFMRLKGNARKVLNKPRLAHLYAQLKGNDMLAHLSHFLYPMLPKYTPAQLALVLHSFGLAKLQDKHLFKEVTRVLEPQLAMVSPAELVRIVNAFASTEISHYAFIARVSAQIQVRVQQESEGQAPPGSCPTIAQLSEIAAGFSVLKFQDYSFFEMCTMQTTHLLQTGLPGPNPLVLARLCSAYAKLKIHDVPLFAVVLAHIADHWYDYPSHSIAEIGASVAPVLPTDNESVQDVYRKMFSVMQTDADMLTLKGVELAARFMAEVDHKQEFVGGFSHVLGARLKDLKDESRERYDVARVVEVFSRRCPEDQLLFSCLCRHVHRHLGIFEPVDFVRFARGLSATEYRDHRIPHALAKWGCKRFAEFSSFDWEGFVRSLATLNLAEKKVAQLRELGSALQASTPSHSISVSTPSVELGVS